MCVALAESCASAIRASSCVNLSNLYSAPSKSILLIHGIFVCSAFLKIISELLSVSGHAVLHELLTQFVSLHFFYCDLENKENLHHYLCKYSDHFLSWLRFHVHQEKRAVLASDNYTSNNSNNCQKS